MEFIQGTPIASCNQQIEATSSGFPPWDKPHMCVVQEPLEAVLEVRVTLRRHDREDGFDATVLKQVGQHVEQPDSGCHRTSNR